jgi:GDP-mannose 6-dehydrogenase
VELTLRSLYADIAAPLFVLPPREALLVKYASNAFHAMKVAFGNEIGAFCEEQDIDADAVMSVFCSDTKLNIAKRYLMPGFAFGGSCLPKDVRALAYAAKRSDIEMPLIGSLLSSNQAVIERALRRISSLGARRLGLIGLAFKPNTDDLRESPYVELAERLLGKGYSLNIYDPNVSIANLTGANKEYIARVIPHLARLLVQDLEDLRECELLLVAHSFPGVEAFLENANVPVVRLCAGGARVSVPKGVADDKQ